MTNKLRVGVIGGGVMGRNHVRVLSGLPGVDFVGLVEPDVAARGRVPNAAATRFFATTGELIAAGVQAAVVAVPTVHHHKVAMELIERGVHVLIEKPIAKTQAEARALIAAAAQHKVVLQVGHIERFNPAIATLKTAIADEPIISISIARVGPFPPRIDDVGIVIDLGVHDIDLVRWISGSEVTQRQVCVARTRGKHEDTAFLQFTTANGTLAHINANWLTPYKERRVHVATTTRFLACDLLLRTVTEFSSYKEDGSFVSRNLPVPFGEPLRSELEAFVAAASGRGPVMVTGDDGLKALDIALACLGDVA